MTRKHKTFCHLGQKFWSITKFVLHLQRSIITKEKGFAICYEANEQVRTTGQRTDKKQTKARQQKLLKAESNVPPPHMGKEM